MPRTPDPGIRKRLQANFRRYRAMSGLTLDDLASRFNVHAKMIEAGRQGAQLDTLMRIADALDIDVGDLLADPEAPVTTELEQFLASPSRQEFGEITPDEMILLRRVRAPGRRPTPDTYYWEMKRLRSMRRDGAPSGTSPGEAELPAKASPVSDTPRRRRLGGRVGRGT